MQRAVAPIILAALTASAVGCSDADSNQPSTFLVAEFGHQPTASELNAVRQLGAGAVMAIPLARAIVFRFERDPSTLAVALGAELVFAPRAGRYEYHAVVVHLSTAPSASDEASVSAAGGVVTAVSVAQRSIDVMIHLDDISKLQNDSNVTWVDILCDCSRVVN